MVVDGSTAVLLNGLLAVVDRDVRRDGLAALDAAGYRLDPPPEASARAGVAAAGPGEVPEQYERVHAALARIGQVRRVYLRRAVACGHPAGDLVDRVTRLDLLVGVLGEPRWDPYKRVYDDFWHAIAERLRPVLRRRTEAWLQVAARLAGHRGTMRGLLRRFGRPQPSLPPNPRSVSLHVLSLAPDDIIAEVLDSWSDADIDLGNWSDTDIARVGRRSHWCGARDRVLQRAIRAGARPRRQYATWIGTRIGDEVEMLTMWPVVGGTLLEMYIAHHAESDRSVRRRLVWARPPYPWVPVDQLPVPDDAARANAAAAPLAAREPPTDLVAALRACTTVLQAEATLCAAMPDDAPPPWPAIAAAHAVAPLPQAALRALADRQGVPAAIATDLHEVYLVDRSGRDRTAALAVLDRLAWDKLVGSSTYLDKGPLAAMAGGLVTIDDVLSRAWPAREVLAWLFRPVDRASLTVHRAAARADLVRTALRARVADQLSAAGNASPHVWPALVRLLPTHDGSVLDLFAASGISQGRPED